jgi:hypothetical protein
MAAGGRQGGDQGQGGGGRRRAAFSTQRHCGRVLARRATRPLREATCPPRLRIDLGDLAGHADRFRLRRRRARRRSTDHYIEDFLQRHAGDIRGRVVEVAENTYTDASAHVCRRIVMTSTIEHAATPGRRPGRAETSCRRHFECFICTQTLTYIYDVHVRAQIRVHPPDAEAGGVSVTVPGISR